MNAHVNEAKEWCQRLYYMSCSHVINFERTDALHLCKLLDVLLRQFQADTKSIETLTAELKRTTLERDQAQTDCSFAKVTIAELKLSLHKKDDT